MIKNDYKLLAGVTVFRELYDTNKDIYDVLCVFIKHILFSENKYTFTAEEITEILNEKYHFSLKMAVVKSALNRFKFPKKNGIYTNNLEVEENFLNSVLEESMQSTEELLRELCSFVEMRQDISLSEKERNNLSIQFTDYLLDESIEGKYTSDINLFLLSIEKNRHILESVKKIKEGNLLYEGIRYCGNPGEIGSWNTDLHIYLDTEILFSLAGYNGETYCNNVGEFFEYVKEINKKQNSGKILLWYFTEVKDEFDLFFSTAEKIVKGELPPDPSNIAMNNIINGCGRASDIKTKYAKFIQLLNKNAIKLYDTDKIYDENNRKYNILSDELLDALYSEYTEAKDKIYKSAKKINHINILRKGDNTSGFENIGHVLLTATTLTLKIANNKVFKINHDVPKATYTDFLINRFWYKLNKGFGVNKTPKTINIIAKSRILLSSLINTEVGKKYDSVKSDYDEGNLEKDEACILIGELREFVQTPENVEIQNIEEVLDVITNWDIQSAIENNNKKIKKATQYEEENRILKEKQEEQERELEQFRKEKEKRENKKKKWRRIRKKIYGVTMRVFIIMAIIVGSHYYAKGNQKAVAIVTAVSLIVAVFPGIIIWIRKYIDKE